MLHEDAALYVFRERAAFGNHLELEVASTQHKHVFIEASIEPDAGFRNHDLVVWKLPLLAHFPVYEQGQAKVKINLSNGVQAIFPVGELHSCIRTYIRGAEFSISARVSRKT